MSPSSIAAAKGDCEIQTGYFKERYAMKARKLLEGDFSLPRVLRAFVGCYPFDECAFTLVSKSVDFRNSGQTCSEKIQRKKTGHQILLPRNPSRLYGDPRIPGEPMNVGAVYICPIRGLPVWSLLSPRSFSRLRRRPGPGPRTARAAGTGGIAIRECARSRSEIPRRFDSRIGSGSGSRAHRMVDHARIEAPGPQLGSPIFGEGLSGPTRPVLFCGRRSQAPLPPRLVVGSAAHSKKGRASGRSLAPWQDIPGSRIGSCWTAPSTPYAPEPRPRNSCSGPLLKRSGNVMRRRRPIWAWAGLT